MLVFGVQAHAQSDRAYFYEKISGTFTINTDTTVDVVEEQRYNYHGLYHLGWRDIPHKGVDAITDVVVLDGDTNKPLQYSRSRLNKESPSSWGKYTVFEEDGATNIEWYYDLADTSHLWILSYTLHGALAFYDDHDELYWNLFTDYTVPVDLVEATITLPGGVTTPSSSFYTSSTHEYVADRPSDSTYHFSTTDVIPRESITFAVGWQKGLVDQNAYWLDALKIYWGAVLAILIFVGTVIFCIVYWLRQKHKNRGRGVIVAEYEPPNNLPAAMADVLIDGSASTKVWPATMVDLAVRGYVTIKEDTSKDPWWRKLFSVNLFGKKKEYIVEPVAGADTATLLPYEQKFLVAVFEVGGGVFSTKEFARDKSKALDLYSRLQGVEQTLSKHVVKDTQAFAVAPNSFPVVVLMVGIFSPLLIGAMSMIATGAVLWVCMAIVFSALIVLAVMQMPRHNKKGSLLKEEWLGFKLYLQTAERYRMQKLTPETFEKYLPYAMIFGVEKQWAKNFESMHLAPPTWYVGAVPYTSVGTPGSFSPGAFATGFSASFASSFASSGGGGASGGGGGAGGGGGGGGGGAS